MTPYESDSLDGLSEERIHYLARIGAIFERLYTIKDLHDAEYRAMVNASFTAKMLGEIGESNERIEEVMRACLLPDRNSWELAREGHQKQSSFIAAYIQQHCGPAPDNPTLVTSEALAAYHRSKIMITGSDGELIILTNPEEDGA
ncbi:hypothetical protein [Paenibacillus radicis (ex Xue et al. 2023)]|uniref:Uncharacterized protein n=1 Tax=Paenibacillus radicis (ex Xue et al. 2023) TaxID=2972489 RepID=A0ABT1YVH2_9BACL|nr:hypothetical protein [Paenibacillus radicis (ex Xue et al. 2023)]MCR8636956.1 hypothetical protein [Paenibacillus radicis (ex Xue et al. 2023)]